MITVQSPATSANCCVGFDSLGLALDWKSAISFEPADDLVITGCPPEYCTKDNLVYQAFVLAAETSGLEVPGIHIHIDSDIPFARGLGSSSQCIAAGLLGADALLSLGLGDERLLALATSLEGHPDNAAPALFGGLCVCVTEGGRILQTKLEAGGWKVLLVIPPYEVSTSEARKVLPACVSLHEAAMQAGRAMLFEHAWVHKDDELLYEACKDVLHEPSRSKLIKEYPAMKALSDTHHLPFWISGSGSTMAFVSQDEKRLRELKKQIDESGADVKTVLCRASSAGAQVVYG